jgi:hypothetical protein
MAQDPYFEFVNYDLEIDQGSDYNFHFIYKDEDKNPVDLSEAVGEMQMRRSYLSDKIILWITGSNATGGGYTKEFYEYAGISGSASILLNVNTDGVTGTTGGVLLSISADMTQNIPLPNSFHFYTLNCRFPNGDVFPLLNGRASIVSETTM